MATETLHPNAAGDESGITATCQYPPSGYHWDKVDEEVADDGTTYICNIQSSSPGYRRDLYELPAHSVGSGVINFIKIYIRCFRNPAHSVTGYAKPSLKSNSTVTDGTEVTLTTSYVTYSETWTTNPADSAAWEWADIDALQIGVSLKTSYYAYCTQVYVEIDYTVAVAPTVVTNTATSVGSFSATLNGEITSIGSANADERGFDYGLTASYGSEWTEEGDFGVASFHSHADVDDLSPHRTYHFRAKAHNSVGWGYGADETFTTLIAKPLETHLYPLSKYETTFLSEHLYEASLIAEPKYLVTFEPEHKYIADLKAKK